MRGRVETARVLLAAGAALGLRRADAGGVVVVVKASGDASRV